MDNVISHFLKANKITKQCFKDNKFCYAMIKRYYYKDMNHVKVKMKDHPYLDVHPWKSLNDFSKDLVKNIIYNKDGFVVLNKPYGISSKEQQISTNNNNFTKVANSVNYTISESLPYIAKTLNYPNLVIVKTPEKFTSGLLLLAANNKVLDALHKSYRIVTGDNVLQKKYWIITTRVPREIEGKRHLGMTRVFNSDKTDQQIVIASTWGSNQEKRKLIKILNVEYKVLAKSIDDLSSLIEIVSSTTKWHALRLFASTILYCPVLGDNIYGSRVQNVLGTSLLVNPFSEYTSHQPQLDKKLLELLNVSVDKQNIIPAHVHYREIFLPNFFGNTEGLTIQAPLLKPFSWTYEKLMFKNITDNTENNTESSKLVSVNNEVVKNDENYIL